MLNSIVEIRKKLPKMPRQGVRGIRGQAKPVGGFICGIVDIKMTAAMVRVPKTQERVESQFFPILMALRKARTVYIQA